MLKELINWLCLFCVDGVELMEKRKSKFGGHWKGLYMKRETTKRTSRLLCHSSPFPLWSADIREKKKHCVITLRPSTPASIVIGLDTRTIANSRSMRRYGITVCTVCSSRNRAERMGTVVRKKKRGKYNLGIGSL